MLPSRSVLAGATVVARVLAVREPSNAVLLRQRATKHRQRIPNEPPFNDRQPPNAYAKLRARRAHDLRLSRDAGGRHERMDAALVSFSATLGRPRRQRRSRRDAQASLGHIRSGAPPAGAGAWRHHRTSYSRSQCPAPAHRPWRRRVTHDPRSVSRSGRRARCGAGARGHGAHGRAHRAFGARSSAPARSTPSLLVLERDGNLTH